MPPRSAIIDEGVDGESSSTSGENTFARSSETEVKSNVVRKQTSLQTPGLMALNFCSAVGIVVVNKALFRRSEGLGFATSLTALHFAFTALGVRVCHLLGMYKTKPLKQRQVLPISIAFCAFVAFNNLSLQFNGVSFYQLMKILTTPAVVVLQLVIFQVVLPFKLLLTLVPICAGVALSNATDSDVSAEGAFWALAGLLAAAGYQVLVKSTQETLQVSSLQLLHHQAPQAAVLVLVASPFFDDTRELLGMLARACSTTNPLHWMRLRPPAGGDEALDTAAATAAEAARRGAEFFWAGAVLASCLLAFLVNLSTFLVIGKTSPVSYQVLGHFKLLVILLAGVTLFGEITSPTRLAGMLLAFAGIVGYTTLKQGLGSGWERRESGGGGADCDSSSGHGDGGVAVIDADFGAVPSAEKRSECGGGDEGKAIRRTR